jgi:hypothetical protein
MTRTTIWLGRGVSRRPLALAAAAAAVLVCLAPWPARGAGAPAGWRVQTSPDPGPSANTLNAVATSPGGAWAVGGYTTSKGVAHTLIARHTSSGWAQVSSPSRWGSVLTAVATTSSSNAWAVGSHNGVAGVLILRWNGTAWSIQQAPYSTDRDLPGLTGLSGVAALSASAAWAVGGWAYDNCSGPACGPYALIEHWNGTSWAKQCCAGSVTGSIPGSWLNAVAATNSSNVWAVGRKWNSAGTVAHIDVLRWNGSRWTSPTAPDPRSGNLLGVTATSATNVWAVGSYVNSNHLVRTLVLHYSGAGWSKITSPNVGTGKNVLTAVHAISAGNIWAVGHHGSKPLIEHYNGTSWTVATTPDVGNAALSGVAGGAYAVGSVSTASATRTLVLHYS